MILWGWGNIIFAMRYISYKYDSVNMLVSLLHAHMHAHTHAHTYTHTQKHIMTPSTYQHRSASNPFCICTSSHTHTPLIILQDFRRDHYVLLNHKEYLALCGISLQKVLYQNNSWVTLDNNAEWCLWVVMFIHSLSTKLTHVADQALCYRHHPVLECVWETTRTSEIQ